MIANYQARREARIERLRTRSAKLAAEGESRLAAASATLSMIPMGQPILVGHHSEKKHRRDIARIDSNMRKGVEAKASAEKLAKRADSAEKNETISSDDPDALDRLRAKLAEQEARHALMVKGNKAIRKWGAGLEARDALTALGFSARDVAGALMLLGRSPYGFNVTNSSAGIRATKARIADLETRATAPPKGETVNGVRLDEAEGRLRLFFAGKPDALVIGLLKGHGFRWSPSVGAWQRQPTPDAWYWGRIIAGKVAT